jgi:hypothetical protein
LRSEKHVGSAVQPILSEAIPRPHTEKSYEKFMGGPNLKSYQVTEEADEDHTDDHGIDVQS